VDVLELFDEVRCDLHERERNFHHQVITDHRPEIGPIESGRDLIPRVIWNIVENWTQYAPEPFAGLMFETNRKLRLLKQRDFDRQLPPKEATEMESQLGDELQEPWFSGPIHSGRI
jgi:hypothetical protein